MQMDVINTHIHTPPHHYSTDVSAAFHRSELNQPNGIHLFNFLIRSLDQKHLVDMKKLIKGMLEPQIWEHSDLCFCMLDRPSLEVWDWVKRNDFHVRKNPDIIRLITSIRAKFCLNWLLLMWGWAATQLLCWFNGIVFEFGFIENVLQRQQKKIKTKSKSINQPSRTVTEAIRSENKGNGIIIVVLRSHSDTSVGYSPSRKKSCFF